MNQTYKLLRVLSEKEWNEVPTHNLNNLINWKIQALQGRQNSWEGYNELSTRSSKEQNIKLYNTIDLLSNNKESLNHQIATETFETLKATLTNKMLSDEIGTKDRTDKKK